MEEKFEELLSKFPELEVVPKTNRVQKQLLYSSVKMSLIFFLQVRCKLSGHEIPYNVDLVESYVKGKKFQKLQKDADFKYNDLKPFIIPSELRK